MTAGQTDDACEEKRKKCGLTGWKLGERYRFRPLFNLYRDLPRPQMDRVQKPPITAVNPAGLQD
jgi:hypothetical protein